MAVVHRGKSPPVQCVYVSNAVVEAVCCSH